MVPWCKLEHPGRELTGEKSLPFLQLAVWFLFLLLVTLRIIKTENKCFTRETCFNMIPDEALHTLAIFSTRSRKELHPGSSPNKFCLSILVLIQDWKLSLNWIRKLFEWNMIPHTISGREAIIRYLHILFKIWESELLEHLDSNMVCNDQPVQSGKDTFTLLNSLSGCSNGNLSDAQYYYVLI